MNDIVDNQVVYMLFEGGSMAVFTMTAFAQGGRKTRLFGTKGEIYGYGSEIKNFDFLAESIHTIDTKASDATINGGYDGGDFGLMKRFVSAVANDDPTLILSGPDITLAGHLQYLPLNAPGKKTRLFPCLRNFLNIMEMKLHFLISVVSQTIKKNRK